MNGQQKPIHRDLQKKQRGNDGQSAVHQSIKQQLDQQFQNGKSKELQVLFFIFKSEEITFFLEKIHEA